ncbi:SDR family NAD(P)-dependent oxidoreductase [Halobacillus sp. A5]|uniref:SDR family NAD(P)-dependent oxidoreductase n=1 Tax=Halobacillus sp. A5 TaxID=2880263 RepID=UPI0020A681BA|nr:SDR family oxidoreductase [Halobacillus sp. A5]MCP3029343.1 SDR family oxidoreductase [Halobacillus sp. A5]
MSIFSNDALIQNHILITGATGGIGYETAKEAVKAGARVTVTGRNEEKLNELKQACESEVSSAEVLVCPADLNKSEDRKRLVQEAVQTFGAITGLVNSAGVIGGGALENLTEEELRSVMELNYFSTVLLTQEVYSKMKELKKGAIVNLSSLSGLRGTHSNTAYSGSKFAITGFTQSFAVEAVEHNIRVNAVCPGYVDTQMGRQAIKNKGEREGRSFEEQLEEAEKGIPSGKLSTPEEVARTVVFLLSDASSNIIGESLKISGGSVMR